MSRKILVLDTTLRDGEQVPGAKLNLYEKLELGPSAANIERGYYRSGFPRLFEG